MWHRASQHTEQDLITVRNTEKELLYQWSMMCFFFNMKPLSFILYPVRQHTDRVPGVHIDLSERMGDDDFSSSLCPCLSPSLPLSFFCSVGNTFVTAACICRLGLSPVTWQSCTPGATPFNYPLTAIKWGEMVNKMAQVSTWPTCLCYLGLSYPCPMLVRYSCLLCPSVWTNRSCCGRLEGVGSPLLDGRMKRKERKWYSEVELTSQTDAAAHCEHGDIHYWAAGLHYSYQRVSVHSALKTFLRMFVLMTLHTLIHTFTDVNTVLCTSGAESNHLLN